MPACISSEWRTRDTARADDPGFLLLFAAEGLIQRSHIDAIRRDQHLPPRFSRMVQLFEKDEFEDEWGPYVRVPPANPGML